MNILIINPDGSTSTAEQQKGCFYPKGFVIQFSDGNVLIDFITQLPDGVWNYWGDSTTAVYFTQDYYYIYDPKLQEQENE